MPQALAIALKQVLGPVHDQYIRGWRNRDGILANDTVQVPRKSGVAGTGTVIRARMTHVIPVYAENCMKSPVVTLSGRTDSGTSLRQAAWHPHPAVLHACRPRIFRLSRAAIATALPLPAVPSNARHRDVDFHNWHDFAYLYQYFVSLYCASFMQTVSVDWKRI